MRPHPALNTVRILWFALLMAIFLHMGIAYGVLPKKVAVAPDPIMPWALGGVAVLVAVMSFLVPRMTYQQAAKAADVKIAEEVASTAFPNRYREALPKRAVFAEPDAAVAKAYACFQAPFIMSIALSEAVALFGLVLAQLGFDMAVSLPFFLTGAALILNRFPQEPKVLAMFEQARGASFPTRNG
jgi:hypothetical protein